MRALKNQVINPNGTLPAVYAIVPYFGGTSIAELGKDIANTAKMTTSHVACAGQLGLPVIACEGGSDSYAAPNKGCTDEQREEEGQESWATAHREPPGAREYCRGRREIASLSGHGNLALNPRCHGVDWRPHVMRRSSIPCRSCSRPGHV